MCRSQVWLSVLLCETENQSLVSLTGHELLQAGLTATHSLCALVSPLICVLSSEYWSSSQSSSSRGPRRAATTCPLSPLKEGVMTSSFFVTLPFVLSPSRRLYFLSPISAPVPVPPCYSLLQQTLCGASESFWLHGNLTGSKLMPVAQHTVQYGLQVLDGLQFQEPSL